MTRAVTFRQADLTRAIKGARAAGIANPRVVIDTVTKKITVVAGSSADSDPLQNEWDEVCANDAPKTQIR
jgi:hypothetical protein